MAPGCVSEPAPCAGSSRTWSRDPSLQDGCWALGSRSSETSRGPMNSSGSWPRAISVGLLFKPRRRHVGRTHVKLFVEMGEFSPGVLEEELADENEGDSKHIDGQESHVGEDGCRIFAPKNELVWGEEFQFTHEPEKQGQQKGNSDDQCVGDHCWFLSVGEFNSLSTELPEWHGKRALSPLATEAPQKRTLYCGGDRRWRGQ